MMVTKLNWTIKKNIDYYTLKHPTAADVGA